jgi:cyclopropane fatty-acyl-phospholipid synthase-like methyltransferase
MQDTRMKIGEDNAQIEERRGWLKHLSQCLKPGKIIEFGCGSGFVLEVLSDDYPNSVIFGVDKSMERLRELSEKEIKNVIPVKADITQNVFPNRTFDTTIFVGTLHEIFSYMGKEKVGVALTMAHGILNDAGVLIIQDFLKPAPRSVSLAFKNEETHEIFCRFVSEFQPRRITFERKECGVMLDIADAVEFISKYRSPSEEDWNEEMRETHFFFTEEEYKEIAQKTRFTIKDAVYLTRSDKRWDGVRKDMVFEFEPEYHWIQLVVERSR